MSTRSADFNDDTALDEALEAMTEHDSHDGDHDDHDHEEDIRFEPMEDRAGIHSRSNLDEGIIIHNGRKYAASLTWLTIDETASQNEVMKRAKSIEADFYCTRAYVSQSGFGYLQQNHRMGLPSIAAMAADVLIGEWHGVFQADNGWLYVAVHADTIAPDGDRFFQSEEDAYNHFMAEAEKFKWPKTYVPNAWNYAENDGEILLDRIVEDVATTALRPVNLDALFSGRANKNLVMIGATIFLVFLFMSFFSQSILSSIVPKPMEARVQQLQVADVLAVPPKEPETELDPLLLAIESFTLPQPAKVIETCIQNFDSLMVSLPGWTLATMRCRSNFVEALWQQSSGSLDSIKPYISEFPFGVSTTYGSRGDFLASRVVGNLAQYNEKLTLGSREDILLMLNNRFGQLGRIEVRDIVPQQRNDQNNRNRARNGSRLASETADNQPQLTIQDLPSLGVSMVTQSSPLMMKEYFNIPGMRLNVVEWDIGNSRWNYDLQVYLMPRNARIRNTVAQ